MLTDGVTENNFQGDDDQPLGREAFFSSLADDVVVEAESFEGDAYCTTGMLEAREVELEYAD